MFIYIAITLILAIFSFVAKKSNEQLLLLISVAALFVVSAWRGFSVGIDTLNYKLLFDYSHNDIRFVSVRTRELLFPYLMAALNYLNLGYRWFLVITAFLFSVFVWVVSRQSNRPLTALLIIWLLGFYFQFYNISRQMIAVLIALSAFPLLQQHKTIWWLAITIAASLVHTSALLALLYYPLSKLIITQKRIIWVAVVMLISFFLPFIIDTHILVATFGNFFGDETYSYYYESQNKGLFSVNRLMMNVFFVVLIFIDKEERKREYATMVVAYLVILNLFPFSGTIGRVALYFGCFQLLYLPVVGKQSAISSMMIAAYLLAVFSMFLVTNNCGMIPYVFGGND